LTCPLRFKLRYYDGIRTPTTPALFIGKATHFGLEVFYRHQQLGVTLDAGNVTKKLLESWGRLAMMMTPRSRRLRKNRHFKSRYATCW
jgi:hypothetical protein